MHVQHATGQAKFWLEPVVALAANKGLGSAELNELEHIVEERQDEIRDHWKRHFRA